MDEITFKSAFTIQRSLCPLAFSILVQRSRQPHNGGAKIASSIREETLSQTHFALVEELSVTSHA